MTQQSNPGNIKNLAYAEIELPVEILRRGFFFVDSPGLGSSIAENTQTTERFLPQADAFVLVTSYESPLSEEEDRILHRIRLTNKRLFVVVNKQDTVSAKSEGRRLRLLRSVCNGFPSPKRRDVFSLSRGKGSKRSNQEIATTWKIAGSDHLRRNCCGFSPKSAHSLFSPICMDGPRLFLQSG